MMLQSEVTKLLFKNRNIDTLSSILFDRPGLNILNLLDEHSNTLLHQLAYQNHLQIIKLFIKHAKDSLTRYENNRHSKLYVAEPYTVVLGWINRRNDEGFTAFLYAAYSGNLGVLRYLVEEQAVGVAQVTEDGLNALHLAAQSNKVLPFLYLRGKVSLMEADKCSSTPLHWAAYRGSEQVVAYILSESNVDIDAKEQEGQTALMLATLAGNSRIIRRLLIKGANRYIQDKQKKTPLHIAKENQFHTIEKMLTEDYTFCDFVKLYCNVRIQYTPKGKSFITPLLFIVSTLITIASLNIFIRLSFSASEVVQGIIYGCMLVLYISLLISKKYEKGKEDYSELMDERKVKKGCFDCRQQKPTRGYHCDVCDRCIAQYDHHCKWINNCVGKHNIARFIAFLIFLVASLASIGFLSFLTFLKTVNTCSLCEGWLEWRVQPITTFQQVCTVAVMCFNIVCSLFLFPVLTLLGVQIKNVFKNQTTFESMHASVQKKKPQTETKKILKKYSESSSIRNCRMMCTRNSIISNRSDDLSTNLLEPQSSSTYDKFAWKEQQ